MHLITTMAETKFEDYLKSYWNNGADDDIDEGEVDLLSNALKSLCVNCRYHDISELDRTPLNNYGYTVINHNIHSLPSKYDHRINNCGKKIHFVLLCETFLTDVNCENFQIPGYHFEQNNRAHKKGGGVGIYIADDIQYTIRNDIAINYENEFESIIIELNNKKHNLIVGEIYRIPNTNEQTSIERYEQIIKKKYILTRVISSLVQIKILTY